MSDKKNPIVISDSKKHCHGILALIVLCFLLLNLPLLISNLWFDECVSLWDYGFAPSLKAIFGSYNATNNHILYSAFLYVWLHVLPQFNEFFIRLPNLLFYIAACAIFYRELTTISSRVLALVTVSHLIFSPVLINFVYQLRGYGFSISLSIIALTGMLLILNGKRTRGLVLFCSASILMPMIIPSNLLYTLTLFIIIGLHQLLNKTKDIKLIGICLFSSGAGMIIYLPILSKFLKTISGTQGWDSASGLVSHLGIAAVCHLGLFIIFIAIKFRNDSLKDKSVLLIFLSPLIIVLITALIKAPFPRIYLSFFPIISLIPFYYLKETALKNNAFLYGSLFIIFLSHYMVSRFADSNELAARHNAEIKQTLLQQYYKNNTDISTSAKYIIQNKVMQSSGKIKLFIDFHYFLSFKYYWEQFGGDKSILECLNGSGKLFGLKEDPAAYANYKIYILSYTKDHAQKSLKSGLGKEIILKALPSPTELTIFER
ncbi:MAG: hypothetical protein HRT89_22625 [Lentisphaeria bacterium]|nr:glucosyltransferase domain-containing protein [Lentisphaeria bacterium]NQZ70855.1 hypothetical protein [Lentisphaeria bacterium]